MTYATNRSIRSAKEIDDYQDSISDPSVRAPGDISGWVLISLPLTVPAVAFAMGLLGRLLS